MQGGLGQPMIHTYILTNSMMWRLQVDRVRFLVSDALFIQLPIRRPWLSTKDVAVNPPHQSTN